MKIIINGSAVVTVKNPLKHQSQSIEKSFEANISIDVLPDANTILGAGKIGISGVSTLRSKIECLCRGSEDKTNVV